MSNEQRTLNEMVNNHEKRVKEMEQVLIDYAMEHNLHLTLTDNETYTSRTLITKRVYDEYEGYATSSEEGEEYGGTIGYNDKKLGDWLSSSELC